MKLYTKTGDSGTTSLANGERVSKSSIRIKVVGALDECNARLGALAAVLDNKEILNMVKSVQSRLFDCGAVLADPERTTEGDELYPKKYSSELEAAIDSMDKDLEPLTTFILPGGCESSVRAHLARSAVRAAEREIVALQSEGAIVSPLILQFMNRLSDWLFVVARFCNYKSGITEPTWQKEVSSC